MDAARGAIPGMVNEIPAAIPCYPSRCYGQELSRTSGGRMARKPTIGDVFAITDNRLGFLSRMVRSHRGC